MNEPVGMVFVWAAANGDIPAAVAVASRRLDAMMGTLRTGEICWNAYEGDAAERFLEGEERTCQSPLERSNLDQVRAYLDDRGGFVVVATAPGSQA